MTPSPYTVAASFLDPRGHIALHHRRTLSAIVALRSFFFVLLLVVLDHFVALGTSLIGLSVCAGAGVLVATILAFQRINTLGVTALSAAIIASYLILFQILSLLPIATDETPFRVYAWREHSTLFLLSGFAGLFTTWAFWRFRFVLTLEFLGLGLLGVLLFTGHRNLRLDKPQVVNDLAWHFGVEPLTMVVLLGGVLLALLLTYLLCATPPGIPDPRDSRGKVLVHRRRANRLMGVVMGSVFVGALALVLHGTYSHFDTKLRESPPEGVGMADKNSEGISPLDFSGQGTGNNQPAALVRLEGDYLGNPFSPMLYLRESALSAFSGQELVIAGPEYDTDLPHTAPEESFSLSPEPLFIDPLRSKLTHSVYMLANHKLAFAIDFPYSIRPLKNPNPARFKQSYRAYSYVPSFRRDQLLEYDVGNPSWSEIERAHYLKTHPDPRYALLANQVTSGVQAPLQQAFLLTDFLSQKSIYTLTPSHDVPKGGDPVAPYLFGDLRGYCVHFAHATTYMLRSLGIPTRIGTGYMTDLSQAKDGHILLRMSDRHAWAEVYIRGIGWVPFDTQPLQVENHADTPVDMKVLEELMSSIDPGEELLAKDLLDDESNIEEPKPFSLPGVGTIVAPIIAALTIVIGVKLFLLFGYHVARDPETFLRRAYRALATELYDLGLRRNHGETREEFRQRVATALGADGLLITETLVQMHYGNFAPDLVSAAHEQIRQSREVLDRFPRWRRLLARLNPVSALAIPFGGRW